VHRSSATGNNASIKAIVAAETRRANVMLSILHRVLWTTHGSAIIQCMHKLVAASMLLAINGWGFQAQTPPSWPLRVEALVSPAAAGSAQPQLSVSRRGVVLSWIEQTGDRATLRFSERTASGWSAARTVASGTDWFVNWADVPSVVRLADGTLAAHWLQKSGADTYAYDVRLSYSRDEGRTWASSFMPHTDGMKAEHGFASLFQMPGAGLGWSGSMDGT
jgi:hypothetical protein